MLPSWDRVLALLSDPGAVLDDLRARLSNLTLRLDPEYFVEGVGMLNALNLCLSLLKLVATYGRKLFALYDTARAILGSKSASDESDGTVQVAETVTDSEAVQATLFLAAAGWDQPFAALEQRTQLDWSGKLLGDRPGFIWLLRQPQLQRLTTLEYALSVSNGFAP